MKALLLAAGLGTRLHPFNVTLPKCLMPIHGVPLLGYWLFSLQNSGVTSTLINLHYLANLVSNYLEKYPNGSFFQTVYEPKLLNTGGTLLANRDFFENEPVMLIHADNYCLADLSEFIQAHQQRPKGTVITMMTYETTTPKSCGIVELDKYGIVQAFHEKVENPSGNLANAGVYILEPYLFNFLKSLNKNNIDFSLDVIPNLMGQINTYHNDVYHRDIGTIESLEIVQHETISSKNEELFSGYKVDPLLSLKMQISLLSEMLVT